MLPAILGSATYQFNVLISRFLASFLPQGSISWLYYADRLVQFPLGVFAIAISTAALPSLSKQVAEKDMGEFTQTLSHALRLVFFIIIPSLVGLIIVRKLLIQIFFERGAFGDFSTEMTAEALLYYSVGLWAFSGIRVIVSAFYAFQDTKTPVKMSVVNLIANLALSLFLMKYLKHGGLALALSLASALQFGLLVLFFKRKVESWDLRPILVSTGKSVLASVVMGLGIYYTYSYWWVPNPELGTWHLAYHLAGLICMGVFIYFALTRLLSCPEWSSVLAMFKPILGVGNPKK
jgi:putative peptidoglycan lipid II flippase